MKRAIGFVFLIVSGFLQAQITFDGSDLMTIARAEGDAHSAKFCRFPTETTTNYDVKWYRCWWNIDPAVREISGNVTTLFAPVKPGFDSLVFDMSRELTVDSVVYRGQPVIWGRSSDFLTIRFPFTLPQLIIDSVSVYYHGVPPENGFGAFVKQTQNGMPGGTPIIWTLSEPYGSSDWWPCKNGLTDKADSLDIFICAPAAYSAASNGILVSVLPNGAKSVHHWKHRYPIATYLICLAVTNYAHYTQRVPFGGDTLEVVNYVYPEDSASISAQTSIVGPMIQVFDTLFGIYPFQREKYGHAQFGWGGGMEHQTMTFVSSFGFELLAHELAHQWFGNKVTCGSWADIWLNEGFGTYLSGLCYEHLAPLYWKRFRQVRVENITSLPGGSVFCTDTTSVERIFSSRLSYAKGAMILHQLRWIMGDSSFFAGLNNYLCDVNLSYGFARTSNLKSHLENSCGQDLSWYFDDWFTGEGFPYYQINWAQSGNNVTYTVNQTQSHPSVAFFRMLVPIQFKNETRDTVIRVLNTFSGQTFTASIPFVVDTVIFDPDCQLISRYSPIGAVAEQAGRYGLRVFPNPAKDFVTVSFSLDAPEMIRLDLLNAIGEPILDLFEKSCSAGTFKKSFFFNQPAGAYFLRMKANGKEHFRKLVVVER